MRQKTETSVMQITISGSLFAARGVWGSGQSVHSMCPASVARFGRPPPLTPKTLSSASARGVLPFGDQKEEESWIDTL
jgi:hypothetical protein